MELLLSFTELLVSSNFLLPFEFGSCKGHPPTGFVFFEVIIVIAKLFTHTAEMSYVMTSNNCRDRDN